MQGSDRSHAAHPEPPAPFALPYWVSACPGCHQETRCHLVGRRGWETICGFCGQGEGPRWGGGPWRTRYPPMGPSAAAALEFPAGPAVRRGGAAGVAAGGGNVGADTARPDAGRSEAGLGPVGRGDSRHRLALDLVVRYVPPGTLVDVGCYRGAFPELVCRARRDLRVVGLDSDSAVLADARRAFPGSQVTYRQASADQYAAAFFPPGCEGVTLLSVLEHLERPGDALREAARALRTGGVCIVTVPNAHALRTVAQGVWRGLTRSRRVPHEIFDAAVPWNRHVCAWTLQTLTTLGLTAGFAYVTHRLPGWVPGMGPNIGLVLRKS